MPCSGGSELGGGDEGCVSGGGGEGHGGEGADGGASGGGAVDFGEGGEGEPAVMLPGVGGILGGDGGGRTSGGGGGCIAAACSFGTIMIATMLRDAVAVMFRVPGSTPGNCAARFALKLRCAAELKEVMPPAIVYVLCHV